MFYINIIRRCHALHTILGKITAIIAMGLRFYQFHFSGTLLVTQLMRDIRLQRSTEDEAWLFLARERGRPDSCSLLSTAPRNCRVRSQSHLAPPPPPKEHRPWPCFMENACMSPFPPVNHLVRIMEQAFDLSTWSRGLLFPQVPP